MRQIRSPHFDLDLRRGKIAEELTERLLRAYGLKVEVKRDFKVSETGNVAIEFEYRGMPSGIAATKAAWWVIWLAGPDFADKRAVLIETKTLYRIAKTCRWVPGGDEDQSKHYLVPVGKLLMPESEFAEGQSFARDRDWLREHLR